MRRLVQYDPKAVGPVADRTGHWSPGDVAQVEEREALRLLALPGGSFRAVGWDPPAPSPAAPSRETPEVYETRTKPQRVRRKG